MSNLLKRFLEIQEITYSKALTEIKNGKKLPQWMNYIFPRLRGVGLDENTQYLKISNAKEAKKYLYYPVLSARLIECTQAVLDHKENDIKDIFGTMGSLDLHASMTLFATVSAQGSLFHQVIERFYGGQMEEKTMEIIRKSKS